jgi:hypothetical protein
MHSQLQVLAEGELHTDGVFHASALGFPPVELRENLPVASQVRVKQGIEDKITICLWQHRCGCRNLPVASQMRVGGEAWVR